MLITYNCLYIDACSQLRNDRQIGRGNFYIVCATMNAHDNIKPAPLCFQFVLDFYLHFLGCGSPSIIIYCIPNDARKSPKRLNNLNISWQMMFRLVTICYNHVFQCFSVISVISIMIFRVIIKQVKTQQMNMMNPDDFSTCQAVKPGIVHLGITDFHRGHQAHFINEILGSNEAAVVLKVAVERK